MRIRRSWKLAVLLTALILGISYGIRSGRLHALADQTGTSDDGSKLEPFPIPEGDAATLFKFIRELGEEEKKFSSAEEQREHQQRIMLTAIGVADRVLGQKDLAEDDAEIAAQMKVQSYINLAVLGAPDPKPARRAIEETQKLTDNPRNAIAQFAKNNLQTVRIICIAALSPKERDELADGVLTKLVERKFAPRTLRQAQLLGESLGESGDQDRMLDYYGKLAAAMRDSGIERLLPQARQIEGQLRRIRLPGNALELDGATLSGDKFDWASYRGKVVLVDYWATWCGPCRQELPNVKKNYKKYHDKGFEVVGISLDEDPDKLQEFLTDQKIPWITLFESDEKLRGWDHPMAVRYGVSAIPMAILVNREGKVVSLSARGPELSRLLDQLLRDKK